MLSVPFASRSPLRGPTPPRAIPPPHGAYCNPWHRGQWKLDDGPPPRLQSCAPCVPPWGHLKRKRGPSHGQVEGGRRDSALQPGLPLCPPAWRMARALRNVSSPVVCSLPPRPRAVLCDLRQCLTLSEPSSRVRKPTASPGTTTGMKCEMSTCPPGMDGSTGSPIACTQCQRYSAFCNLCAIIL